MTYIDVQYFFIVKNMSDTDENEFFKELKELLMEYGQSPVIETNTVREHE